MVVNTKNQILYLNKSFILIEMLKKVSKSLTCYVMFGNETCNIYLSLF